MKAEPALLKTRTSISDQPGSVCWATGAIKPFHKKHCRSTLGWGLDSPETSHCGSTGILIQEPRSPLPTHRCCLLVVRVKAGGWGWREWGSQEAS